MKSLNNKKGVALLISLWILIILSLIVGSIAIEMNIEGLLLSKKRKSFNAEVLALSGIDYARAIIEMNDKANELEINDTEDDFMKSALYVKKGLKSTCSISITNMGSFDIIIETAETGRNINKLERYQWSEIFEMANIPSSSWDELIDCLYDWIDEGDLQRLNGAESDDPYYEERFYPVKNAPLDSVNELLLIKNWNEDILFGKEEDEFGDEIIGIADLLTVWGDGKVNLNTASTNLLLSYAEYEDWELSNIMESRIGLDGVENTLDDGIKSIDEVNADSTKFKLQSELLKVTSIGKCGNNKYSIECIMKIEGNKPRIVFWNEEI